MTARPVACSATSEGATVTPVVTTAPPAVRTADSEPYALVQGETVRVRADGTVTLPVPAKSVTTFVVEGVSGVADGAAPADDTPYALLGLDGDLALTAVDDATTVETPDGSDGQTWTLHTLSGEGTNRRVVALSDGTGAFLVSTGDTTALVPSDLETARTEPRAAVGAQQPRRPHVLAAQRRDHPPARRDPPQRRPGHPRRAVPGDDRPAAGLEVHPDPLTGSAGRRPGRVGAPLATAERRRAGSVSGSGSGSRSAERPNSPHLVLVRRTRRQWRPISPTRTKCGEVGHAAGGTRRAGGVADPRRTGGAWPAGARGGRRVGASPGVRARRTWC